MTLYAPGAKLINHFKITANVSNFKLSLFETFPQYLLHTGFCHFRLLRFISQCITYVLPIRVFIGISFICNAVCHLLNL